MTVRSDDPMLKADWSEQRNPMYFHKPGSVEYWTNAQALQHQFSNGGVHNGLVMALQSDKENNTMFTWRGNEANLHLMGNRYAGAVNEQLLIPNIEIQLTLDPVRDFARLNPLEIDQANKNRRNREKSIEQGYGTTTVQGFISFHYNVEKRPELVKQYAELIFAVQDFTAGMKRK